jgi:hypothetical protein
MLGDFFQQNQLPHDGAIHVALLPDQPFALGHHGGVAADDFILDREPSEFLCENRKTS